MRNFFIFVFAIVILAVIAWALLTFVLITDKERVLKTLEKARLSVENGSVLSLGTILAPDYIDSSGLDRAMLLRSLTDFFQKTENRQITFIDTSVQIEEDQALAQLTVRINAEGRTGNPKVDTIISSDTQTMNITVQLIKEGRRWYISRTDYTSIR